MLVAHQAHEFHHTLVIQLVKDVVEQQNRLIADLLVVELELCQADGHHEGFLLSLRAETLQRMAIQGEIQVILMDAHVGVARIAVLLQALLQKLM